MPATQHRYDLARAEFIAATKALHPDVADWRTVSPEDDERIVGHFMIFGRSAYKAVRS